MSDEFSLSITDLDFESITTREKDAILEDIRNAKYKLGKFTLRDAMEAIYGEAYTLQVLGPDGGNDVLVEDLSANDEVRRAAGQKTSGYGSNHIPTPRVSDLTEEQRQAAFDALDEHEKIVEQAVIDSIGNNSIFSNDMPSFDSDDSVDEKEAAIQEAASLFPENKNEIAALLRAAMRGQQ